MSHHELRQRSPIIYNYLSVVCILTVDAQTCATTVSIFVYLIVLACTIHFQTVAQLRNVLALHIIRDVERRPHGSLTIYQLFLMLIDNFVKFFEQIWTG